MIDNRYAIGDYFRYTNTSLGYESMVIVGKITKVESYKVYYYCIYSKTSPPRSNTEDWFHEGSMMSKTLFIIDEKEVILDAL